MIAPSLVALLLLILIVILGAGRWPKRRPRGYGRRVALTAKILRRGRKPAWVIGRLVRLKALMPDAGCRSLADVFNRPFAATRGVSVSKSFVAYTLRGRRYEIEQARRDIRARRATAGPRNRVWGLDLTGKRDGGGEDHAILGLIDHGTRRLLTLRVAPDVSSWSLLGHVFLAIGRYGKPRAIRTDNGSNLTSRLFRAGLRWAGIRHERTEVGCPWQNGRIERLFGTLKSRLDRWAVADGRELGHALDIFSFWYNVIRPHQNLDGRTPMEAWAGIDPYRRPRRAVWFSAWDGLLVGFHMRT